MPIGSIYSNSYWSSCNQSFNLFAPSSFSCSKGSVFSTLKEARISSFSCIWILFLGGLSEILDVLESSDGITSIAPMVFIGTYSRAIDELLLAQIKSGRLILELNLIAFMRSSCGKSPAWTAWSLVLYLSHNSFISPINFTTETGIDWLVNFFHFERHFSQIKRDELLLSDICELIDPHLPSLSVIWVMLIDFLDVVGIDLASIDEFLSIRDALAVSFEISQVLSHGEIVAGALLVVQYGSSH